MKQSRFIVYIILLVSAAISISACSNTAAVIRKVTYPPDFKYVSGQELRSYMSQLAFQLQQLDLSLAESNTVQPARQQEVIDILGRIETIGEKLQAGEAGSNHPFLQDYMGNFVNDISHARIAASLNPPIYYLAGRVTGSCTNCHKINR